MAKTKKRKKSAAHIKLNTATIVVTVTILLLGLFFFTYVYIDKIGSKLGEKMEDLAPSAFTYPTKYEEYVLKYSKEYDVDPVLVFSVIKVESDFNPKAESNVGARGLMQLMEDAYDWVKFRMGDEVSQNFDDMYDPETNIKYGAYYLSYLMDKYNDSVELTAAAYHCGMGEVDGWLDEDIVKADKFDVRDIPKENDQTAYYVEKIDRAYSNYKEILASRESDTESNNSKQTQQAEEQDQPG